MRDHQRICILEVTESLAAIFETHSRILSGPTGQLTFQLRSGDDSETTEDPMVVEENTLPVQPPNPNLIMERLQSNNDSASGSAPFTDINIKLLNQNSPCAPVGFADDGAVCFRGIDPETLVEIAQPKINQAVEWGARNGLSFSVDKTTAVFFSRQKKFQSHVLPKLKKTNH